MTNLRNLLEEAELELRRASVFVRTREKMHETGLMLYDDLLRRRSQPDDWSGHGIH